MKDKATTPTDVYFAASEGNGPMTAQTRHLMRRLGVAVLALSVAFGVSVAPARGATHPALARFPALDGGGPVLPHIKVTAMTATPGGALYAAGVYVVPNTDQASGYKVSTLGSAWLVSQDHGATWDQRVSTTNPKAFPARGIAPWTNHNALPIDFTPLEITVDPHNPRVIYIAGCVDIGATCYEPTPGMGGHLLVRSTDGGRTWQDALTTSTPIARAGALPPGTALPTAAYALLVDPRNSRRLYLAVNDMGVVRSEDAGRTWVIVAQPQNNKIGRPCELLTDPHDSRTVYELAREGALYRTTDAGAHWQVRAGLNGQLGTTSATSLTWVGHTLYVTTDKGIAASQDDGATWRIVYGLPVTGSFDQSVRGAGGWISTFSPLHSGPIAGLYSVRDGNRWQAVANTEGRGIHGALDFSGTGTYLETRLWEDHAAHVVFTAGPDGGLYRWQATL